MGGENPVKPYVSPNPFGVKQKYWERIQNMRLLDDMFMTAAFDNNIEATQLVLRIILKKEDLKITRVKTQVEFKNLYGHSLRMDVDATDSDDAKIDIEIERSRYRAYPERARYHSAIRDVGSLKAGKGFDTLPTSYIIFITETDIYGKGLPLYHFDRTMKETGEDFGDRTHIIYVNGEYEGEDPIGLLMADFRESDPSKMHFPELAKRVNALKNSEEEVKKMCQAMEITYQEGQRDSRVLDLQNLMETLGLSLPDAFKALKIPVEDQETYTNMIQAER